MPCSRNQQLRKTIQSEYHVLLLTLILLESYPLSPFGFSPNRAFSPSYTRKLSHLVHNSQLQLHGSTYTSLLALLILHQR